MPVKASMSLPLVLLSLNEESGSTSASLLWPSRCAPSQRGFFLEAASPASKGISWLHIWPHRPPVGPWTMNAAQGLPENLDGSCCCGIQPQRPHRHLRRAATAGCTAVHGHSLLGAKRWMGPWYEEQWQPPAQDWLLRQRRETSLHLIPLPSLSELVVHLYSYVIPNISMEPWISMPLLFCFYVQIGKEQKLYSNFRENWCVCDSF